MEVFDENLSYLHEAETQHQTSTPETEPAGAIGTAPEDRPMRRPEVSATLSKLALTMEAPEAGEQLEDVALSTDPVRDYLRQAARHELLSADEEVKYARQIEVGVFAEERL